ncbi:MAG: uroporphyrinogen-III C-methyltransferase [Deltaproteobacteria bacterium]|nr:uroporphyrinogen-III C-methyltransferase [Deltaproteobacteria bacterium]
MAPKTQPKKIPGTVYLVGAGPGDPGLLTLKAQACLERADLVFFDQLVNPEILSHCPRAKRFDVGKRGHRGHFPQDKIAQLLVQAARRHHVVVRLKGGDPFVFGRGGEEAEALRRAGVPFEIVPGVTSAVAVPAYAGIPVTHRGFGSSVAFVTGHEDPEKPGRRVRTPAIDWEALARIPTLVLLMGVKTLEDNFARLVRAGKSPATPAAIVEWGTYPRQRSRVGDLRSLPMLAKRAGIRPPAVTVVGEVVRLKPDLDWYEAKPLFGRRILVTRAGDQASELSRRLREAGAQPLELSALEIRPPRSWAALDRALAGIEGYDWLIFTSVHAVEAFLLRLKKFRKGPRALSFLKIAAVGPVTARRLEEAGFSVARLGESFTSEALGRALRARELKGKRILFPRAEVAREAFVSDLRKKGASVEVVFAYRTGLPRLSRRKILTALGAAPVDLLTFASGATAENLARLLRQAGLWERFRKVPAAAIGPVTRAAARRAGFRVVAMPRTHTIEALVEAIASYFSKKS